MGRVRSVSDGLLEFQKWATDTTPRVGLGLPFFDSPTSGGIARSEIAMVIAYSSVGKTTLGLNVLRAHADKSALIISLEMSWRMVVSRMVAMETSLSTQRLEAMLKGGIMPPEVQKTVDRYPLLVCDDTPEMTVRQMYDAYEEAASKLGEGPRIVLIDYMELIGGGGMMDQPAAMDKVSRQLRNFARSTDASVILLHQQRMTDGDGSKPLHLGSGKFGGHQPMDYVVGAYKPSLNRELSDRDRAAVEGHVHLQLLKNRNGPARQEGVRHQFDSESLTITPYGMPSFAPTPIIQQLVSVGATGMEDPF
jgi:replicative DNA helicase